MNNLLVKLSLKQKLISLGTITTLLLSVTLYLFVTWSNNQVNSVVSTELKSSALKTNQKIVDGIISMTLRQQEVLQEKNKDRFKCCQFDIKSSRKDHV